jgi:hypothetical protein
MARSENLRRVGGDAGRTLNPRMSVFWTYGENCAAFVFCHRHGIAPPSVVKARCGCVGERAVAMSSIRHGKRGLRRRAHQEPGE